MIPGTDHLDLVVSSFDASLPFYADLLGWEHRGEIWLRERGTEIESGPKEYDYTPGYYAVFFYDPDGIKLELVHRPPDTEEAS